MLFPIWRTGIGAFQILARAAAPATIFLVMTLGYTLARITWNMLPESPGAPVPERAALDLSPTAAHGPNIQAILDAHLFGKIEISRPSGTPRPVAVPETPLKVTLRGTVSAKPPDGWVILAESGGPDQKFRLGAIIPGNALIQEIHPQKVILLRNQRIEILEFPKNKDSKNLIRTGNPSPPPMAMPPSEPEPEEESSPEPEPEETPVEEDPNQSLNYYREQLLRNPANLAGLLQTLPVYRNGKLEGFRVRPGAKGGHLLERFGLQSNDLVTSINGIPLDNPMKAFEVLRGLRNAPTLDVGLSRQGRNENITLRFAH